MLRLKIRRAIDSLFWRAAFYFRSSSSRRRAVFTRIYRENEWCDDESVSGPGSTIARGADFRTELLQLLRGFEIRSIVDAPCGDFNWMRSIVSHHVVPYVGVDIVEELVNANTRRYASADRRFVCRDLTRDELPKADLIVSRDAFVHMSFADIGAAVRNFKRSGSRYVLATTFVGDRANVDIPTGGWRVLNMQAPPLSFPAPLAIVDEHCTHSNGIYRDKRLGLWEIAALPE